ncbi:MAG: phosphoribosylglycinamide formyltransferase [Candidatus Marinimicrobia bacterium]|nr:phosphoribosylglycinamide formyltransferase [Candidatus Neomarinimicrobiota bacterium]
MKKIAIFASGKGSNFEVIYSKIKLGEINGEIVCFITNNPNSLALQFAEKNNIPSIIVDLINQSYTKDLIEFLKFHVVELIVLAGYIKLIPSKVVEMYENKIINIHPALLPAFGGKGCYGMNVHIKVWESGVKYSGVSVHFVNNNFDEGKIITQQMVSILQNDTPTEIAEKVLKIEHQVYPEVIKQICNNNLKWINNKPWILK